ncbi:transaldolase family protein [Candidatus Latescibacterota bacterium]
MKIFLDTANLEHIKEAVSWSIIDGVTTNPSLIKKAVAAFNASDDEMDIESYINNILASVGRMCPVSLEVAGLSADTMVEQGTVLYENFNQIAGNVVIKIPVCTVNTLGEGNPFDGLLAIKRLSEEKIPINATLVFTPEQALLAAKAGADYVSPFAGRVDDRIRRLAGMEFDKTSYFPCEGIEDKLSKERPGKMVTDHGLVSGVDLIEKIVDIFNIYGIECEVIAASVRNPVQVSEVAATGAHIVTMPYEVLRSMILHPGTADGIDAFTNDLVEEYLDLFTPLKKENSE